MLKSIPINRYKTSIEEVFRQQLDFIRVCGGLLFDWPLPIALMYKLIVFMVFRYLTATYYTRHYPLLETYPKSSQQNIKLFLGLYGIVSFIGSCVSFYTVVKYHHLILVVLRKQFCRDYLSSPPKSEMARDMIMHESLYLSSGANLSVASSIPSLLSNSFVDGHKSDRSFNLRASNSSANKLSVCYHRHVTTMIVCNLLLNTMASYLRSYTHKSYLAKHLIPTQRHLRITDIYPPLIHWEVQAVSVETTDLSTAHDDNTLDTGLAGFVLSVPSQMLQMINTKEFAQRFGPLINELYHFVQDLIIAAMHMNQTYGHLFIVLMTTSVMSDMLRFATKQDRLDCHKAHYDRTITRLAGYPKTLSMDLEPEQSTKSKLCEGLSKSRFLLTTKLLIQIRDVLILLRCILSLDYLIILIADLSRIMIVVCMLTDSVQAKLFVAVVMSMFEGIRVIYTMLILRIGHEWLHNEANRIRRLLDQRILLSEGSHERLDSAWINKREKITVARLSEDIESTWPTDWFSPDMKTLLKHGIIIITFVTTLQQLVEAGSRLDYQTNVSLSRNVSNSNN